MDLQLNSKKAFISGSTQGIGFAIARQLLKEGASVVLNGRDDEKVNKAAEKLRQEFTHSAVSGIAADFSNKEAVEALLQSLDDIDILINNVGIFELKEFKDITDNEWMELFEINVLSSIRLSRHLLPRMLEQNFGRIIFISSESGAGFTLAAIYRSF